MAEGSPQGKNAATSGGATAEDSRILARPSYTGRLDARLGIKPGPRPRYGPPTAAEDREARTERPSIVFAWLFLALGPGLVLSVACFNLLIDPYQAYGIMNLQGLNSPKTEMDENEKLAKALIVANRRPPVLVLGTSRAEIGIDARHPLLSRGRPAFNLAMAGGTTYVMRRYLEHAASVGPIEEVVIGLDLVSFNVAPPLAPDFKEEYLGTFDPRSGSTSPPSHPWKETLLSLGSLKASWRTLHNGHAYSGALIDPASGNRVIVRNGHVIDLRSPVLEPPRSTESPEASSGNGIPFDHTRSRFRASERIYLGAAYLGGRAGRFVFADKHRGTSSWRDMERIVDICKTLNAKLSLFISPVHARQLEVIHALGLWPTFESWKRHLVDVLSEHLEGPDPAVRLWDFSGYNRVTEESVPERGLMYGYIDSSHYTLRVGDRILERMFGSSGDQPLDFGVELSPASLESVLSQIRRQRAEFLRSSPSDAAEISAQLARIGMPAGRLVPIEDPGVDGVQVPRAR